MRQHHRRDIVVMLIALAHIRMAQMVRFDTGLPAGALQPPAAADRRRLAGG